MTDVSLSPSGNTTPLPPQEVSAAQQSSPLPPTETSIPFAVLQAEAMQALNQQETVDESDEKTLTSQASAVQSMLSDHHLSLRFMRDPSTNKPVVEVVDETQGRVVRTIPPATLINHYHDPEALAGVLVDKTG